MSLSQLRHRVDAFKRKLAVPLAVVQLRPLVEEFCDEWVLAVSSGNEPPPAAPKDVIVTPVAPAQADAVPSAETLAFVDPEATGAPRENVIHAYNLAIARKSRPYPLIRRVADAGFRTDSFMSLVNYMDRCRNDRVLPRPSEILRSLLPKAAALALIPKSPPAINY